MTCVPAKAPCGSCPYRRDVPAGVWTAEEYEKLPPYDAETPFQPVGIFYCHQQDGRICAGWAGTHDMEESCALRVGVLQGAVSPEEYVAILEYESSVPLFASGWEAAEHGMSGVEQPDEQALRTIHKLERRLGRHQESS